MISSLLSILLSYLLLYKYFALFLYILAAGIIVPLPANTLLFAIGAFSSQGYFNLALSFAVALIANVLGDFFDFMLTSTWGQRAIKRSRLEKIPYLPSLEKYLNVYAGPTIIVTRFMSPPGPIVNFLSGLSHISAKRFLIFDLIGNTLDIGLFLILGYFLGTFTEGLTNIFTLAGWMLLIGLLIFVIMRIGWPQK